MIYLIFSILSSSLIYILFKFAAHHDVKIFPVIVINYIIAAIIGLLLSKQTFDSQSNISSGWFYASVLLGILFIIMFYVIGLSTVKAGITITSISSKMSVVIPILFSIFFYNESITSFKVAGIFLAVLSIFLISTKGENTHLKIDKMLFPILLFVGMGVVDSLVKFNQQEYLQNQGVIEASTVCFITAAIVGVVFYVVKRKNEKHSLNRKSLLIGFVLGLVNFGSLFFLIQALNSKFTDSSIIFAINNTFVIISTTLAGRFIFNEKIITLNWIGIIVSLLAIVSLSC